MTILRYMCDEVIVLAYFACAGLYGPKFRNPDDCQERLKNLVEVSHRLSLKESKNVQDT